MSETICWFIRIVSKESDIKYSYLNLGKFSIPYILFNLNSLCKNRIHNPSYSKHHKIWKRSVCIVLCWGYLKLKWCDYFYQTEDWFIEMISRQLIIVCSDVGVGGCYWEVPCLCVNIIACWHVRHQPVMQCDSWVGDVSSYLPSHHITFLAGPSTPVFVHSDSAGFRWAPVKINI